MLNLTLGVAQPGSTKVSNLVLSPMLMSNLALGESKKNYSAGYPLKTLSNTEKQCTNPVTRQNRILYRKPSYVRLRIRTLSSGGFLITDERLMCFRCQKSIFVSRLPTSGCRARQKIFPQQMNALMGQYPVIVL
jgi:hypothetical protein